MSDPSLGKVRAALARVSDSMRNKRHFDETQKLAVKMFTLAAGRASSANEIRPDFALMDYHLRQDALFNDDQLAAVQHLRDAWHECLIAEAETMSVVA